MKDKNDIELMQAIQAGNLDALGVLHSRYASSLHYFFLRSISGRNSIAADLVQDLFIRIFEKASLFDTNRNFKAWLFSIAHNMVKNEYAKNEVRNKYIDSFEVEQNENSFENKMHQNEKLSLIFEALESLDLKKKEQFILRFKMDFSIKEIASITDCPEGSVKSGLHYSIKKIKQKLGDYGRL